VLSEEDITITQKVRDLKTTVEQIRILLIENKRDHDVKEESNWCRVYSDFSKIESELISIKKSLNGTDIKEVIHKEFSTLPCKKNWRTIKSIRRSMIVFYFFLLVLYFILFHHSEITRKILNGDSVERYNKVESQSIRD